MVKTADGPRNFYSLPQEARYHYVLFPYAPDPAPEESRKGCVRIEFGWMGSDLGQSYDMKYSAAGLQPVVHNGLGEPVDAILSMNECAVSQTYYYVGRMCRMTS